MAAGAPTRVGRVLYTALAWLLPRLLRLVLTVQVTGTGNLPTRGPALLVGNHISPADPLVFLVATTGRGRRPVLLGLANFFTVPVLGPALRAMGHIPVHRGSGHDADALAPARRVLAAGGMVGLYPEGRVSRDPDGWPERGRTGAARLAIDARVPVVPVVQWGIRDLVDDVGRFHPTVLARDLRHGHRHRIRVHIGPPLTAADLLADRVSCRHRPGCGCARVATDRLVELLRLQVAALRQPAP